MADYPYIPLYWRDWLTDQRLVLLTPEQKGAFIELRCHAWGGDPPCTLPDDDHALAMLSRLGSRWRTVGRPVRALFEPTDNGRLLDAEMWKHYREMLKRSERRRRAGAKGLAARYGSPSGSQSRGKADRKAVRNAPSNANRNAMANGSPASADAEEDGLKDEASGIQASSKKPPSAVAVVENFANAVGRDGWKLKTPLEQWTAELLADERYRVVDVSHEIRKCREWHEGKRKRVAAPDRAIRNWLDKAVDDVRSGRRMAAGSDAEAGRARERDVISISRAAAPDSRATLERLNGERARDAAAEQTAQRVDAWIAEHEREAAELLDEVKRQIEETPALKSVPNPERFAEVMRRKRIAALIGVA